MNIFRNEKYLFLLFVVLAVLFRMPSFLDSVMDHDESTYLIMGAEMLHGKILYTDIIDTKPAGIFIIYSFFQFLTGYSIFLKRLLVAILVGVSGFLIYRVSTSLFNKREPALASGWIYVLFTSSWIYFGISPNTELFFNFFTIAGLLFFLKNTKLYGFAAGLMFGIGFMIKYLVLFDYVAIGGMLLIVQLMRERKNFSITDFLPYFYSGIGFLLPFALANFYFWVTGNYAGFRFVTFELVGNYGSNPSESSFIIMLLDFTARFLPIFYLMYYVLFSKNALPEKWHKPFFVTWLIAILIAMFLPGKGFTHYCIQLMVPVSLLAGQFYNPEYKFDRITEKLFKGKLSRVILALIIMVILTINIASEVTEPDYPRVVAKYLKENLKKGETVYTGNYRHIIYYLLQQESPTKYVHPTILTTELRNAFEVDASAEIQRILDTKPEFVLIEGVFDPIETKIAGLYLLDKTFDKGHIKLYRRSGN